MQKVCKTGEDSILVSGRPLVIGPVDLRKSDWQPRSVEGAHGGRAPLLMCWPPCSFTLYTGHHTKKYGAPLQISPPPH